MAGKFVIGDIFLFSVRGPLLRSLIDWGGGVKGKSLIASFPVTKTLTLITKLSAKPFLKRGEVQSLSCNNEFNLNENKNSLSHQKPRTQPRFETETWSKSEMARRLLEKIIYN